MKILLTGGTGLIGRHLIARLQALHHDITVVTRSPEKARQVLGAGIDIWRNLAEQQNLDGFDAVINLAGEPIADKRWTEEQNSSCAAAGGPLPRSWLSLSATVIPRRRFSFRVLP